MQENMVYPPNEQLECIVFNSEQYLLEMVKLFQSNFNKNDVSIKIGTFKNIDFSENICKIYNKTNVFSRRMLFLKNLEFYVESPDCHNSFGNLKFLLNYILYFILYYFYFMAYQYNRII